jgi:hypothetical protein
VKARPVDSLSERLTEAQWDTQVDVSHSARTAAAPR